MSTFRSAGLVHQLLSMVLASSLAALPAHTDPTPQKGRIPRLEVKRPLPSKAKVPAPKGGKKPRLDIKYPPPSKAKAPALKKGKKLHLDAGVAKDVLSRQVVPLHAETPEEKAFIEAYVKEIESAMANVASNPKKTFSKGSLESRFRPLYLKLDKSARARVQKRFPLKRTAGGTTSNHTMMRSPNQSIQFSPGLKEKFRRAVFARMNTKSADLFGPQMAAYGPPEIIQTWVEEGASSKEVIQEGHRAVTVCTRDKLDFRWWTHDKEAEEGQWELRASGGPVLGTGNAGVVPPLGEKRSFKVNLAKYLPKTAPEKPLFYRLSVEPRVKASITKTPGATPSGGKAVKKPAESVGPMSQPVIIKYSKDDCDPQKIWVGKVYRKATFHLSALSLVEDQSGSGTEEHHVAGYVQESQNTGKNINHGFGPYHAFLLGDNGKYKPLRRTWTFDLNHPKNPEWPRAYVFMASIMEEDAGSEMKAWVNAVRDAAAEAIKFSFPEVVEEWAKQYWEEHKEELIEQGYETARTLIDGLLLAGSAISAAWPPIFVGMVVVAAVVMIGMEIFASSADDYYGVRSCMFILRSNEVPSVQFAFPGRTLPDGKTWRSETQRLRFQGQAQFPSASSYDGQVDLNIYFTFSDPGEM